VCLQFLVLVLFLIQFVMQGKNTWLLYPWARIAVTLGVVFLCAIRTIIIIIIIITSFGGHSSNLLISVGWWNRI